MSFQTAAFVTGCQRSGTTLLRLLFESHPDVASIDETIAYPVLAGRRSLPELAGALATRPHLVFKVPRFAEQLLESDIRDEAYGTFPQFYTRQQTVFVVRQPRDVVASMLSLGTASGTPWIEIHGRAALDHRCRHRAGFRDRWERELRELARRGWPHHLVAATYWLVRNAALPDYVARGLPVLPIRYEALVDAPEPTMRAVLAHFGIRWDPLVLAHHEAPHGQLESDGRTIGGSDPRRPIDRQSVGRHRDVLDSAMLADVDAWTEPLRAALAELVSG